jgi:predicted PurR-regulated permease PerM
MSTETLPTTTPAEISELTDGERTERALKSMYAALAKRIDAVSLARLSVGDWVKITFRFLAAQLIVAIVLLVIAWLPVALLFGIVTATR